jgi:hypothetical protein
MHVKPSEGPEGLWLAARCLISSMYVHASPGFLQPRLVLGTPIQQNLLRKR